MEKEERILGREDFETEEWYGRMVQMSEASGDPGEQESAQMAAQMAAQTALVNYIKNLGGVREEVCSYLTTPRFPDTASVAAVTPLLCYAAPVEWMELSVAALNRDRAAGVLYVNEIAEAYQAEVPIEEVKQWFYRSKTAFDMCRFRRAHTVRPGLFAGGERKEENPRASGSGDGMTRGDLVDAVTEAVTAAMQNFTGAAVGNPEAYREEPPASMTRSDREELPASMTRSDGRNNYAGVADGGREELPAGMTPSDGGEPSADASPGAEEAPDFPDGTKGTEAKLLVTELSEAEEQAGKRLSFFRLLLNRHMKRAFAKLDKAEQESKLFEIMVGRRYGKGKIVAVRRLLNGGMSNEFIFSLLEEDLPEAELINLCETLLPEKGAASVEETERREEKKEGDF